MTIRRATVDDAPAITRLHIASWQTTYRGLFPDALLDGLDYETRLARRTDHLEKPWPGVENWVLEVDGHVIGWSAVGTVRDEEEGLPASTLEMYALYLDPAAIGHGHGKALMDHALETARGRGATEMTLWVLRDNPLARPFYLKAGFVDDERVAPKPFPETDAMVVRMHRAL